VCEQEYRYTFIDVDSQHARDTIKPYRGPLFSHARNGAGNSSATTSIQLGTISVQLGTTSIQPHVTSIQLGATCICAGGLYQRVSNESYVFIYGPGI
jgi:hypothetical protein